MLVRLNEKERKKMNRIAKWDNAKFVLIILVVICHFYENYLGSSKLVNSLFFSVYTFHMPAFFLISGMFSKKTVKEKPFDVCCRAILSSKWKLRLELG